MADFSRNTIVQLIRAFRFATHAELSQVAMLFSLEDALGPGGLDPKATRLMEYLIKNPDLVGPSGGPIVLELGEYLFKERCQDRWGQPDPAEQFPDLVNALRQDGYEVAEFKLHARLPAAVPLADSKDGITLRLEQHSFDTAKGHLVQAIDAHTRGDWAAANGQLRAFVEELFDRMAEELSGGGTSGLGTSHARREWLATCDPPFLDPDLNEWQVGGSGGFIQGFWRRMHPEGAHPGLSDEADSTFRLHLVLIVAEYLLRRFEDRSL
jgi:hypothetical protein